MPINVPSLVGFWGDLCFVEPKPLWAWTSARAPSRRSSSSRPARRYQGDRLRHRDAAARQHRRRRDHRWRRRGGRDPPPLRRRAPSRRRTSPRRSRATPSSSRRSRCRSCRTRELAESIYWEAEQYIPFDIQDVNLDYQILDRGDAGGGKGTMDVLLVAAKKEKIADYTGVIAQAGPLRRGRRRRRLRAAERLRGQLRHRPERGGRAAERRRQRHQHQHPPGRSVGLHPRHLDRRQRLHRGAAARAEPALRERRRAQARPAGRGRDLRRRAAGAARGDRERHAGDPEDVRLLQGDRRLRQDRPDRPQRRRVARRGLHRDADRSLRGAGRDASIRSRRSPSTPRSSRSTAAEIAPTVAVAVGLALRRAGDR